MEVKWKRENNLEFSTVVFIGIEVRCDDDTIAELATGESLLGLLAVSNAVELYKYLKAYKEH